GDIHRAGDLAEHPVGAEQTVSRDVPLLLQALVVVRRAALVPGLLERCELAAQAGELVGADVGPLVEPGARGREVPTDADGGVADVGHGCPFSSRVSSRVSSRSVLLG